jgi:hypothetical protein
MISAQIEARHVFPSTAGTIHRALISDARWDYHSLILHLCQGVIHMARKLNLGLASSQ